MCSSFMPEADLGQTASIAGLGLDTGKIVAAGNLLWWHVLAHDATNGEGPHRVHHPKCVRLQNSLSLRKPEACARSPVPSTVLCSKRNIILKWLIALRARASLVRDVGFGLWLANEPKVARTRKSSEKAAPRRSVERNSNLRLASLGFLKCLCLFSSVVTFIGLN